MFSVRNYAPDFALPTDKLVESTGPDMRINENYEKEMLRLIAPLFAHEQNVTARAELFSKYRPLFTQYRFQRLCKTLQGFHTVGLFQLFVVLIEIPFPGLSRFEWSPPSTLRLSSHSMDRLHSWYGTDQQRLVTPQTSLQRFTGR